MEIIFEFVKLGSYVKVSAVDVNTGTEAVVTVPEQLSQKEMEEFAMKRLKMILKKNKNNDSDTLA